MHKRFAIAASICLSLCANLLFAASSHAISSTIVIAKVLTGTSLSASAELIELHNQSLQDVDITGWKLQYLSASGTTVTTKATLSGVLGAGKSLAASSTELEGTKDVEISAGMPETGGRLRIIDANGVVTDALSWGASALSSEGTPAPAPQRGQFITRIVAPSGDNLVDTDNNAVDFELDTCLNITGSQPTVPNGHVLESIGLCVLTEQPVIEYPVIHLSEILPDPGSPKTDANDEFIELYNPHDAPVDVSGYRIMSGSSLASVYTIPNYVIPAHGFLTLYSSETKISLVNSGGKLQLQAPDNKPIGDVFEYGAIGADQAWAFFDDGWKLTDKPTPSSLNELVVGVEEPSVSTGSSADSSVCPAGKYRNPLTNRCRNIESDASVLAACDDGEYRSPDTNRCRKVSLATASVTSCQVGYERNPDTNRCRKTVSAASGAKPCAAGQERNPETNRCRKVAGASTSAITDPPAKEGFNAMGGIALGVVGLVAVGYGVYEWRSEIAGAFGRMVGALGKK